MPPTMPLTSARRSASSSAGPSPRWRRCSTRRRLATARRGALGTARDRASASRSREIARIARLQRVRAGRVAAGRRRATRSCGAAAACFVIGDAERRRSLVGISRRRRCATRRPHVAADGRRARNAAAIDGVRLGPRAGRRAGRRDPSAAAQPASRALQSRRAAERARGLARTLRPGCSGRSRLRRSASARPLDAVAAAAVAEQPAVYGGERRCR